MILMEGAYKGLRYQIRRMSWDDRPFFGPDGFNFWYNGYVVIPKGHKLHGIDYHELQDLDVHGGLTFSGILDDVYLLGFDTNHLGDRPDRCNVDYVMKELMTLIEQINERGN